MTVDLFEWIAKELQPETCTSETLIYDHMESQSGRGLPIIYRPFDPDQRGHWRDRGAALDFVLATQSQNGRVLDFGPGDGWPSLIIAPRVAEVVGVEGSQRRVAVCRSNAERLGITNATFHYVPPGRRLPFDAESFDAVVAASSVEQSPDPRATLEEAYRVLRPGGRLRMIYESLGVYRGGDERGLWASELDDDRTRLVLYDRHIEQEYAIQVALTYALPPARVVATLRAAAGAGEGAAPADAEARPLTVEDVTVAGLEELRGDLVSAGVCTTVHPSGTTLARWLTEIGFRQVQPTHDGIRAAGALFDRLAGGPRPDTLAAIDAYLEPIVDVVVTLLAPTEMDPAITAVK